MIISSENISGSSGWHTKFGNLDAPDPALTISNPNFQVCSRIPGNPQLSQLLSPSRNARSQMGSGIPLLLHPNLTCIECQESLVWLAVPNPDASLFRSRVKLQDGFSLCWEKKKQLSQIQIYSFRNSFQIWEKIAQQSQFQKRHFVA